MRQKWRPRTQKINKFWKQNNVRISQTSGITVLQSLELEKRQEQQLAKESGQIDELEKNAKMLRSEIERLTGERGSDGGSTVTACKGAARRDPTTERAGLGDAEWDWNAERGKAQWLFQKPELFSQKPDRLSQKLKPEWLSQKPDWLLIVSETSLVVSEIRSDVSETRSIVSNTYMDTRFESLQRCQRVCRGTNEKSVRVC